MNVLLTSATGYVGSAVAKALQTAGHQVIGIARSEASAQRLAASGIQPYRGDLTDAASLGQAAQMADAVIHTAATNDANMASVDRSAVETILAALEGTEKPFVYTSGIWVMGDTAGQVADETFPLYPSPIVAWRPAIEELVLAAAQQGVRSLVIRPALVYGQGGGLVAMLMQHGRDRNSVPVVGDGLNAWSLIHVEDLANLYVKAMEQAPAGTLLIGASGEYLPLKTIALAVARAAGVGDRIHSLTLDEARETWGLLADAIALDQKVSGERARQLLNWVPSAPSVLEDLSNGSYRQAAIAA
jgi:nucleoside-diphosphate-sugar epimerase